MGGKNIKRFEKTKEYMGSEKIHEMAKGDKKNVFTRTRKLPFKDLIYQILIQKGLTTLMEIRFFANINRIESISKQAYFKARLVLQPIVFVSLNDNYLSMFYESESEVELWNEYLVLAIDGSKVEIPNSKENREIYGTQGNGKCDGPARASISGFFDVKNGFYLDLQIADVKTSEKQLAIENLKAIKRIGIKQKVLVIFDRGYPSIELLNYLEEEGIDYIIRLPSSFYKQERKTAESDDSFIKIMHTQSRLDRIQKSNRELYEKIKDKECINTRLITGKTPSDKDFAVFTSLPENITSKEIVEAYFKRWKIEEAYNTLKNKMKFESVSGMSSIYVKQDFLAQIFVYNMMEDVRHSAEEQIKKNEKKYKYPRRINQNMAIGIFKEKLIWLLLEDDNKIREKMFEELQAEISKYTLPIRKSKSRSRKFNTTNKYACNQKPSF